MESLLAEEDGKTFERQAFGAVVRLGQEAVGPHPGSFSGYSVVRELGEGGMGIVYEAAQQNPPRRVALKVIRAGRFAGRRQRRLFEREAEMLGRLKHPNIATVYESGETEEGQPFLAMELVEGVALDRWLEPTGHDHASRTMRRKDAEPRLRTFRQICDAIAHAHQNGVIHRDIKPSNVMVSGDAVKVLDFGLARGVEQTAEGTLHTETGMVQGSAGYMSPEQARGESSRIDTRSDIYSLGILLYRMITRRHPFLDGDESLVEALAKTTSEAPRPFRTWFARFDEDLETIVRKAIEKEPERRYQTVSGLAADLDRYLAELPVAARPPSTLYQLRMMVRRHRSISAVGAALVVVLIAFTVTTMVQSRKLRAERDRANQEAATAQQVSGFLVDLFRRTNPAADGQGEMTVRDLLREGRKRLDKELADQPELRARLLDNIGTAQSVLGPLEEALGTFQESVRVRDMGIGPESLTSQESWNGICITLYNLSRFRESVEACRKSVSVMEKHLGADSTDPLLARNLGSLAVSLRQSGDLEAAERAIRKAIEKDVKGDRSATGDAVGHLRRLGSILRQRESFAEAVTVLRRALEQQEAIGDLTETAFALNELGLALNDSGDGASAEQILRRGIVVAEKIFGPDHANGSLLMNNIAFSLVLQGRYQEAEAMVNRGMRIFTAAIGSGHARVADFLATLGDSLEGQRRFPEARTAFQGSLGRYVRAFGEDDFRVHKAMSRLGCHLLAAGNSEQARERLESARVLMQKSSTQDSVAGAINNRCLGETYAALGNREGAEPLLTRSHERLSALLGTRHPETRKSREALASALKATGAADRALQLEQDPAAPR